MKKKSDISWNVVPQESTTQETQQEAAYRQTSSMAKK
jgi:hypothetical protein